MPEPIRDIDPAAVAERLAEVRSLCGDQAEVLVASKYVPAPDMHLLAEAGIDLVGENQLGALTEKQELVGERFTWDFIGNLQSRKVRDILPRVRMIHSLASDSAAKEIRKRGEGHGVSVLVQVNVAGEESKGGIDPSELGEFIARCGFDVHGLSTMPPFTEDPEDSRPHFARLAELAADHGLSRLSIGTSQDWRVALEEGATTIRLGSSLLRGDS